MGSRIHFSQINFRFISEIQNLRTPYALGVLGYKIKRKKRQTTLQMTNFQWCFTEHMFWRVGEKWTVQKGKSGRSRLWTVRRKRTVHRKWTVFWRKVDGLLMKSGRSSRKWTVLQKVDSPFKSVRSRGKADGLQYWMVCGRSLPFKGPWQRVKVDGPKDESGWFKGWKWTVQRVKVDGSKGESGRFKEFKWTVQRMNLNDQIGESGRVDKSLFS